MKTNIIFPLLAHSVMFGGDNNPFMDGLEAHYKLDEYAGARLDSTGRYHLYESDGYLTYAVGKLGNGVDANTNGVRLAASTSYGGSLSSGFTVCGWISLHSAEGRHAIVNSGSTNTSWWLWQESTNTWQFGIGDSISGVSQVNKTVTSIIDTWYFVVGRYNPATKKAEINVNDGAKAVSSTALSNSPSTAYRNIVIGNMAGDEAYGIIDSVSLWTRYLSDAEIVTLYNSGDGIEYPFTGEATAIEATEAYAGPTWYVAP